METVSLEDGFDRMDRLIMDMTDDVERPTSETIQRNQRNSTDTPITSNGDRPNTTKSRLMQGSALSGARLARTPVASRQYRDSLAEDEDRFSHLDNAHVDHVSNDSFLITELRDQEEERRVPPLEGHWDSLDFNREHSQHLDTDTRRLEREQDDEYDTDLEIEEDIDIDSSSLDASTNLSVKSKEGEIKEHDPTGRTLYGEVCERLGVVPVSYFLRHITDPVIVMRHHGLGPGGARAIAKTLKSLVTCEKLDLSSNWIEGDGGRYMTKVFQENDYIHEVRLADNRLGSEGAKHICKMLNDNATLRVIDLSGNEFNDKDATIWAEALDENKYCKILNLSRNYFGDEGGKALGPAIASNDVLEELDLSWNQIRERGGVAIAKGLKENIRIKVCNLAWNGFGTKGGIALADALVHNEALVELDISGNRIDTGTAELIVKKAAQNELLIVLKMGCNPISTSACVAMINFLTKSEISVLELLDLTDIPVEFTYLKAVENLKQIRSSFTEVHGLAMRSGNTQDDVGKPAIDPQLITNPLMVLREHIVINDTKIMDVLQKYDTERTYSVTKDEFSTALQEIGVTLEREHLNEISERLATTDEGKIFYGDILKRLQPGGAKSKSPDESSFTFGFSKAKNEQ